MSPSTRKHFIQAALFITTIATTTMAGAEWMFGHTFSFVIDFFQFLAKLGSGKEIPFPGKTMSFCLMLKTSKL